MDNYRNFPKLYSATIYYCTEAIKLIQEFSFNKLNLNKLELEVRTYNNRAIHCYEKYGFVEEGRLQENFFTDGEYTDTLVMGILKSEYENRMD